MTFGQPTVSAAPKARVTPPVLAKPTIAPLQGETSADVNALLSTLNHESNMAPTQPTTAAAPAAPTAPNSAPKQTTEAPQEVSKPGFWAGIKGDSMKLIKKYETRTGSASLKTGADFYDTTLLAKTGPLSWINKPVSLGLGVVASSISFPGHYLSTCWDDHKSDNKDYPYLKSPKMIGRVPYEVTKDVLGLGWSAVKAPYKVAKWALYQPSKNETLVKTVDAPVNAGRKIFDYFRF